MNIKIDDLDIVYENPKFIINNIDNFTFQFDSIKNQLILTRKEVIIHGWTVPEKDVIKVDWNKEYNIIMNKDCTEDFINTNDDSDSDITIENDEEENDIENENLKSVKNAHQSFLFTNNEKDLIKDIKGCELHDVYIDENRITTVVWKNLLIYLFGKLNGQELFAKRFINIIFGKPNEEQKNKQKYVYCEKYNISIKASSTQTIIKEILYIVRAKGLKIRLIYKKDGELKEFVN